MPELLTRMWILLSLALTASTRRSHPALDCVTGGRCQTTHGFIKSRLQMKRLSLRSGQPQCTRRTQGGSGSAFLRPNVGENVGLLGERIPDMDGGCVAPP